MNKVKSTIVLAGLLLAMFAATESKAAVFLTTTSLPKAYVGTAYSQAFAATGGMGPYAWAATTALPPGLLLSKGGVLKGIPTTAGSYAFAFTITDTLGASAKGSLSLSVDVADTTTTSTTTAPTTKSTALYISTASVPTGTFKLAYGYTLAAAGGTSPYSWALSAGNLPPGILLGTAGKLKGTPTAVGSYSFTVMVTDSVRAMATYTYSLTITK